MRFVSNFFKSTVFYWCIAACSPVQTEYARDDWAYAGGSEGQQKYSQLDQINQSNVAHLEVAWVYRSGNPAGNIQMNPLVVDGTVFLTTPSQELVAVDGTNGRERWRFDPARNEERFGSINRGLAYWRLGREDRVFFTSGGYLNAVNARSGKAVRTFGDGGRVDLNEGLVNPPDQMGVTSPAAPVIFGDLVIVGAMTWSGPANVSAFNVHTGERKWIFHTIPQPGEYGYETWGDPDFWKEGAGVNVWGGLSVDSKNSMVYFATGQPKDDFYRPANQGEHLFGNCIVALDASTGGLKWHFQAIHHDLWDLDLPCAPILTALDYHGRKVPGVAQLTKTGHVLLFNRITGEVLSEIEERAVPESPLYGEAAWPTQPYVSWPEPFAKQVVKREDLTQLSPEANAHAAKIFDSADAGWFVPPSMKGIVYYGIHGGAEWGGGAYNPASNTLFVNSNELAWHITMRNIYAEEGSDQTREHPGKALFLKSNCLSCHGADRKGMGGIPPLIGLNDRYSQHEVVNIIKTGRGAMPPFSHIPEDELQQIAAYLLDKEGSAEVDSVAKSPYYRAINYIKFLDDQGYPATAPPWGTLNAIDLTTGKIKWKVPLGEYPALTAKGVAITGTENFGGSIATAGGLVFIGATRDERFRAFDQDSGNLLWETRLPHGGFAVPSTYMANGKQYVVIPATGGGKLGTPTGDGYVAFALPDQLIQ